MNSLKKFVFLMALSCSSLTYAEKVESLVDAVISYNATIQTQMELDVFNQINQKRAANFLPPLSWSPQATTQARNHSLNMANKLVPFGHQGADVRFNTLRNQIFNLIKFGENVAYNRGYSNPVQTAVNGWIQSPGHYANIMGDFNLTGVGVAKNIQGEHYFTQIFVKTSSLTLLNTEMEGEETSELFGSEACEAICESAMLIDLE